MTKNYGNLIINIFWRIITLCLVVTLSYFTFDSIANEHYRVVPGSIDYRVTTKGKHFKNFTVKNSDGKTYRLEGKVDKNGRIIYFVNGEKMQIQSKMSKYIKSDERTYCNRRDCKGHSNNKYNRIDDNEILCYHENEFYLVIRILIFVLCIPLGIGLIFGIIRNNDLYKRYNDYDYIVNRKYDTGDYFTPFGLYIDSVVCKHDLKKYIKEFFGYNKN
jgi:hypothetical protein